MMVQRFIVVLLIMVVWVGCGKDESGKPGEKKVPLQNSKKITKDSPKKITWDKDGAEMVLIPAGFRETGDSYDEFGDLVSSKVVKFLDAFYMDTTEVTVSQFKKFLKSSGYKPAVSINWNVVYNYSPTDKHPMIMVNWHDATSYAKWVGKRLPTEAEWEFAARGGLVSKEFPWGDDESVAREYVNYAGIGGKDQWEGWPNGGTAPVGSFKPNGYGLFDMVGNVFELCAEKGVLRGGSWLNGANLLRVDDRDFINPTVAGSSSGFRCVSGFPAAQQ